MRRTAATYPTITAWIGCLAFAVAAASCKASNSNQGSGGSPATSSSSGTGGTSNTSASSASGGSSATGGVTSSGGSSATGGSTSADGSSATGGSTASSESSASGGTTASGGSSATSSGGSSDSGGATSAGGSSAAGGSSTVGGSSSTGGATSAGGATGSGGSSATGGTTPTLGCSAPLIPPNGNVTDFSDFDSTAGKWGNTAGFYGAVFSYGGLTQAVDAFSKNFHITGTLASGAFGGAGLSFYACATVTTFNSLSFTIAGSAPGCDIELQVQTFDQLPTTNTPPGGCVSNCYGFPSKGKVAIPSATPTVVTTVLGTLSNWSQASAAEVVGIQFQFSVPQLADGGTAISCPIDVTIDDVKFGP